MAAAPCPVPQASSSAVSHSHGLYPQDWGYYANLSPAAYAFQVRYYFTASYRDALQPRRVQYLSRRLSVVSQNGVLGKRRMKRRSPRVGRDVNLYVEGAQEHMRQRSTPNARLSEFCSAGSRDCVFSVYRTFAALTTSTST